MKLTLYSQTESRTYSITYLEVETSVGNFVILDNHAPLLLILSPEKPIIFCRTESPDSQEKEILKYGGILKVNRSTATLIING